MKEQLGRPGAGLFVCPKLESHRPHAGTPSCYWNLPAVTMVEALQMLCSGMRASVDFVCTAGR